MFLRIGLLTLLLVFCSLAGTAQVSDGKIRGRITDGGEAVISVPVLLLDKNKIKVSGHITDDDGYYQFSALSPGKYYVRVDYDGKKKEVEVDVLANQTIPVNISLSSAVEVQGVTITAQKADKTVAKNDIGLEQLRLQGERGIGAAAATGAGVYTADGGGISIRGGLGNQTAVFVDGIRQIGGSTLPQLSIKNLSIITGGTPPWYGDLTSGVIEITTQDPNSVHELSGEFLNSHGLDPYGYLLGAVGATGPILTKPTIDDNGKVTGKRAVLGYFLAGEVTLQDDSSPAYGGVPKLKDDVLRRIEQDPLRPSDDGKFFIHNGNFVRRSDFEYVKKKNNNWSNSYGLNFRLDWKLNESSTLKIGANAGYGRSRGWGLNNSVFAPESNGWGRGFNSRAFIRFTQMYSPDSAHNAVLKDMYYTLQADYTQNRGWGENPVFGDDIFRYGYIGRFENKRAEAFQLVLPGESGHRPSISPSAYWRTAGFVDTAFRFIPASTQAPYALLAQYNIDIQEYLMRNPQPFNNRFFPTEFGSGRSAAFDWIDLQRFGGVLNGGGPSGIYSIFSPTGVIPGGYSKNRFDMVRLTGQATFTLSRKTEKGADYSKIKGTHTIKVGFEFEQRYSRGYAIGAGALWGLMRNLTNKHLAGVDTTNQMYWRDAKGNYYSDANRPDPNITPTWFTDTVRLNPLYSELQQANFDRNLRQRLGLAVNSLDYINTDNLDPSILSVGMFSSDELFNVGKPVVDYQGYDRLGNFAARQDPQNFFTDKINRPMNAIAPTYISAYIQDKFEMDNIYLSLGLRVDRLDMAQKILKDKFIITEFYNVGDARARNPALFEDSPIPSNVTDDWIPYARNFNVFDQRNRILGYRKGDQWFDAKGNSVAPQLLFEDGRVRPLLAYPNNPDTLTYNTFKDYVPQVNWMPRVSFSFPITDRSNFFAHYDVLTQRPTGAQVAQFTDYLFLMQNATIPINNPALVPQQTVDYEVGYLQSLNQLGTVNLTVRAFYREIRGEIQSVRNLNAFPITYDSFENIDFGTIKGFTFEFKAIPVGRFTINANYTLQYAEATGSGFTTSRNALNGIQGFSVLRNLLPRTFDQRHTFAGVLSMMFDDRFPTMQAPKVMGYNPLNKVTISVTYRLGSGTPWTRNALPNQADVQGGVNPTVQTKGRPLSNRLPWNYNFDLRINKNFVIDTKKANADEAAATGRDRKLGLDVYLAVLNVLDRRNILSVFSFSGLPDNSGYLETGPGQLLIERQFDPVSFVDMYRIAENNPGRFSLPRRVRLGCILSF